MPEISRSQLLVYGAIAVVVAIVGARYLQGAAAASEAPPARGQGTGTAAPDGASAAPRVLSAGASAEGALVHVAGAVRHPGVYRLPAGARVRDAVRRAGGASRSGDANAINLAAKVADGQQVLVPRRQSAPAAGAAATGTGASAPGTDPAAPPAAPISLSSATAEQLETLDGVGPATAQKILAWRTEHGGFRSIDDLGQVPGIGPKRLAALRPRLQP
jgi:competence protein ComEA